MDLSSRVERLISPAIEAMGFEIVRVQLLGKERRILQIMAERRDGGAMLVDDCAEISRAVSAVLDVEDSISGTYALEVSSPGIDRPLVRIGDFERFAGYEAKVEMDRLIDGRKRFKGRLLGVEGETVRMKMAEGAVELPFQDIRRAKLVLTDELIAAPEKK
ncbi:MAG TPA: ribosome maturation factor RimP [Rhodospirillales bacterium]|nr:ribosome maturation factor RimP [Rhodospirillales bacterium]